jgi:hypothetical protein
VACSLDLCLRPTRVPWRLREVCYLDTPTFALRNASFILRRRAFYTSGIRRCKHEFRLKFCNSDRGSAAAIDLRPNLQTSHRLKFKENVFAGPQGIRLLSSNACDFKSKDVSVARDLPTLSQIFPVLDRIGVVADVPLVTVNSIAVDEELISLGRIDFGGGINGKVTLAIWRNRLTKDNIVSEFFYQIIISAKTPMTGNPAIWLSGFSQHCTTLPLAGVLGGQLRPRSCTDSTAGS